METKCILPPNFYYETMTEEEELLHFARVIWRIVKGCRKDPRPYIKFMKREGRTPLDYEQEFKSIIEELRELRRIRKDVAPE